MLHNVVLGSAIHQYELAIDIHMCFPLESPCPPHPSGSSQSTRKLPELDFPLAACLTHGGEYVSVVSLKSSHPLLPPLWS